VTLDGFLAREDGHVLVRRALTGDDPVEVGTALADHLLDDEGGRSLGAPFDGGLATVPKPSLPLSGWRVVVTRAAAQAPPLVAALAARGAEVVELATISVEDPADGGEALRAAAREVDGFDWVVFTSANAVARLVAEIPDPRALGAVRVAAIGAGTAKALRDRGVDVDLVPDCYVAEALVARFPPAPAGGRVLLPRAAVAREILPEGLRRLGWEVEVVEAYRTVPAVPPPAALEASRGADAVVFTSSSTVDGYRRLVAPGDVPPVVVSIGPVTSATLGAAGVALTIEAGVHSLGGLVDALVGWAIAHPRPRAGGRAAS
jgi:uroporphyrinogen III methyltransferase/synthase